MYVYTFTCVIPIFSRISCDTPASVCVRVCACVCVCVCVCLCVFVCVWRGPPLEAKALRYNSSISLFNPPTPSSENFANFSRKSITSLKLTAASRTITSTPFPSISDFSFREFSDFSFCKFSVSEFLYTTTSSPLPLPLSTVQLSMK